MNIIDEIVREHSLEYIRKLFEHGCTMEMMEGCFEDISQEEKGQIFEEVMIEQRNQ